MGRWSHYSWRSGVMAVLIGATLAIAAFAVTAYIHGSTVSPDPDIMWKSVPAAPSATYLWIERASLLVLPVFVVVTVAFAVVWLRRADPK